MQVGTEAVGRRCIVKEQPELTVREVPVDELVPYAGNAKKHSDYQVGTIAASIEEFGNCDPIAVWHNVGGEMEIVEGHGRVLALKKLGIKIAPVIFLDHLTDEQRRAYTHVHNQTTLNSGFDPAMIEIEIQELPFDFQKFGFEGEFSSLDLLACDSSYMDIKGEAPEKDTFNVTLTFDKSHEPEVAAYIKEHGKEGLVAAVLEEVSA